jgi:hypothetical protein
MKFIGLFETYFSKPFMCLGFDGASTFQQIKYGITISMNTKHMF